MAENKTVKYHIPHRGIYMYSHVYEGKTEMIVLNSTGSETKFWIVSAILS